MTINKSVSKTYILTYLVNGISIISSILIYYIISHHLRENEFEKYNLSKRVISLVHVALSLGVFVGIAREVSIRKKNKADVLSYLIGGVFLALVTTIIFSVFSHIFPIQISTILWNSNQYGALVKIMSIYIITLALTAITTSILRGLMEFKVLNTFTLFITVLPLLVFYFSIETIEVYFLILSIINFVCSFIFIKKIINKHNLLCEIKKDVLVSKIKILLGYGIPRVPGDFALEALFTIPVVLTAHLFGSSLAAELSFTLIFITTLTSLLNPINIILLPYSASFFSKGKFDDLRHHMNLIFKITIPIVFFISIIVNFYSLFLLDLMIERPSSNMVFFTKVLTFSFVPFSCYLIIRSINDGVYFKAINTTNLLLSLITYFISFGLGTLLKLKFIPIYSFVLAIMILGVLSIKSYHSIASKSN